MSEVPSGIVMLHDLETLDLRNTTTKGLPAGIVQLVKLQHLLTGYREEIVIPIGIGNMTNLREFSCFNITMSSVGAVEELGNLINLNVLHVRFIMKDEESESHKYQRHTEMLVSSLCKLGSYKLQSMCINRGNSTPLRLLDSSSPLPSCLQRFEMYADYSFSKLPKWIAPALTSLTYLAINLSEVTQENLGILGELPALLSLVLSTDKVQEDRILVRSRGFQCLKEFVFEPFDEGTGTFLFEEGALPKLEKLELMFCVSMAKANGFYLGIEQLRCLKDFVVFLHKEGATTSECKAAAAAIRNEASLHPNHPRLTLTGEVKETDTDEVDENQSDADKQS